MSPPEILAVIPARGGSKSIPHKNSKLFAGHPLVAFSIAAARQSQAVNRVIVSTDDPEIAEIAQHYGAEVPFFRPPELAQDDTPDLPVFQHALRFLHKKEGYRPEIVVQLRPTSPLRPRELVNQAIEILKANSSLDSVRGVVPAGQNPYKMWTINDEGSLRPLLAHADFAESYNSPRQALPATYWQTGHVDAIRTSIIVEKGSMSGSLIWPLLIDPQYTVDIDMEGDWRRAEWLAYSGEFDIVWPGRNKRPLPQKVALVLLDFDGVVSDNRVWVSGDGKEMIAANRSDGLGIEMLLKSGIQLMVVSKEDSPVVAQRCEKLRIPYRMGIGNKASAVREILSEWSVPADASVFLGNDVNDLPCFPLVACALAVADAHPAVLREADIVLGKPGGFGAIRELCDLILRANSPRSLNEA